MTTHETNTLDADALQRIDAYWRAANYLAVGQIYLCDNPLLKEPLSVAHVKHMLLGHWGTTPGQNFIYTHLNRAIKKYDLDMIYMSGPGHGGPAVVAGTYLEGTYSEVYANVGQDESGLKRLFTQFSFPGGIPSHASAECPGSIHEGGELGYSLSHAFGAVFDNPNLTVACVIGDGEAETGPLATSWHSNKFLNAATDGAVLPILHLNGYKIANPTILARISREELDQLLRGYGWTPHYVEGHEPDLMHEAMAATLDTVVEEIQRIQSAARTSGVTERPRWPMIVFASPKGWTGPKTVDGLPVEGTFRAHQVPISDPAINPQHLAQLEAWLRSYRPQELFDDAGRLQPELAALAPQGERRMGANPNANGGDCCAIYVCRISPIMPSRYRGRASRVSAIPARSRLFCATWRSSIRYSEIFEFSGRTRRFRTGWRPCFRRPIGSGRPRRRSTTSTCHVPAKSWRC
jgi:xylulose-5-phosphate/fructose-6-phosphate phosphoketolase